jgi:hypothetical protein
MLRYPGPTELKLNRNQFIQSILVLQTAIVDRAGRVLVPEGSSVLGQFEVNGGGSRFIAQSLSLRGQSLPLLAESGSLGGARQPAENKLLQNSGIGALAGVIIGGLSGGSALGGAAAGAAITYAISPRVATVQPGQTIEIRLMRDLVLR